MTKMAIHIIFCFGIIFLAISIPKDCHSRQGISMYNSINTQDTLNQDTLPLKINFQMLKMFEGYKQKENISDSLRYQLLYDQAIRASDLWAKAYMLYILSLVNPDSQTNELTKADSTDQKDSISPGGLQHQISQSQIKPERSPSGETTKPSRPSTAQGQKPLRGELQGGNLIGEANNLELPAKTIVSYHIQIAASRKTMSQEAIKRLYEGDEEVYNYQEDEWEKYYIGNFSTYEQSLHLLRQINVKGAFPIAFVTGIKTPILKAKEVSRAFSSTPLKTFHQQSNPQYRIQISASRTPLSTEQLQSLYPQTETIGFIFEDNWYKYSIEGGETLEETLLMLKQIPIKGAFVVRYQQGIKIPLR